jgi:endonuclease/exonuclease/phosphatase family metal-dependent hydrolase
MALREPAILMGDLNSEPDSQVIKDLVARPGVDDPIQRLLNPPPESRVDYILIRGLKCADAGMVDEGDSDHPLFWVDIEMPEKKQED